MPARSAARAFLRACAWDVAVRKPGNVSWASAGHRMQAQMFLDSAEACVGALTRPGASVGERIEAAVAATWARVGCNTNLGIVLLCAPTARAHERLVTRGDTPTRAAWRQAWRDEMAALTLADTEAAFRAISMARPGGLGEAPEQDVRQPPTLDLRAAMALAAGRDRIAAQYRDAGTELFDIGLAAADGLPFMLPNALGAEPHGPTADLDPAPTACVQRVFLAFLASAPDSHIVRKHGPGLAHSVMTEAVRWDQRAREGHDLDAIADFITWDETLKAAGVNPGTTADLTVATLMLAVLSAGGGRAKRDSGKSQSAHGAFGTKRD